MTNLSESCNLCSGFPVLENVIPPQPRLQGVPPNSTCQELNDLFSTLAVDYSEYSDCLAVQAMFERRCCDFPSPSYVCEANVRSALLESYDASVMPLDESGTLQVEVLLDLLHISDLSTKAGTVNVFVWLHLTWRDPRLAWDISDDNCTTSITVRASMDMERTEMFVPDVDLLNQANGGVQTFPDAMATVYNDGTVVWKRNGGLKAFCFFTGLNRFPFDTLGCSYLIGAWVREENVEITLVNNTGWAAGGSLDEVIYNEYTLVVDRIQSGYYYGLKSIVYYNLYFERSSRYYTLKVLLPTIVFTILSFGVFFLDLRVGERLTYGLTVLLVIIAQDISTSSLLPITDKRLWINTFVVGSFYWVLITNLESVFVAYLYFLGDDDHDHSKMSLINKHRRGNRENANGDEQHEDDSAAAAIEPATLNRNHVGEQAEMCDGSSGSLLQGKESTEHKAVSFAPDTTVGTKDQEANVQQTTTSRRALFGRAGAKSSRRLLTFRQLLMQSNQPTRKRHQTIKRIDSWFFWILSSTYVLFVVIMFATNSLWDDENHLYVEGDEI